jgi:hypothetical protein
MASLIPTLLYIGNDANQTVYTNSKQYAIVKSVNVANTSEGTETFSVYLVPEGDTPGIQNALMKNVDITSKNVLAYDTSIVVPNNASLFVEQESSSLTFTISGVEYVL